MNVKEGDRVRVTRWAVDNPEMDDNVFHPPPCDGTVRRVLDPERHMGQVLDVSFDGGFALHVLERDEWEVL